MNKWVKSLIIVCSLLTILFVVGRLTNAIQFYSVPTISNYPTLKPGDHFLASNLIKPKRFGFICYRHEDSLMGKEIYIHRLCGLPGDKVEIKMGRLYVNDSYFDSNFTLAHKYLLSPEDYELLNATEHYEEFLAQPDDKGHYAIYVADKMIKEKAIKAEQKILQPTDEDGFMKEFYGQAWNQDNFGPITVPPNKYFVLGDNRLFSQDSRYTGFIDQKDYLATFVCKY
jgi:signal peptidase I